MKTLQDSIKKVVITFSLLLPLFAFAQPNGFNYQAVAYGNNGQALANSNVTVKFFLLENAPNGLTTYAETHNVSTDATGGFNLIIGQGSNFIGSFAAIDWSNNSIFLKVEINGATAGVTQLMAVPYALHAKTASSVSATATSPVITPIGYVTVGPNGNIIEQNNIRSVTKTANGKYQVTLNTSAASIVGNLVVTSSAKNSGVIVSNDVSHGLANQIEVTTTALQYINAGSSCNLGCYDDDRYYRPTDTDSEFTLVIYGKTL